MSESIAVVTGGCGFIGSHMVDLLVAEGFRVNVIDNLSGGRETNLSRHFENPAVTIFRDDIRDLDKNHEAFEGADYVFHFAGIGDIVPSIERPVDYIETNLLGTIKVLECAREAKIKKFVYAASSSCYGLAKTPTDENHPIDPRYPYALSKYQGEEATFHWAEVYGLPVNSVRIFNAYGPRSRTTGAYGAVFGVFLKQKLAGEAFTVVGDGTQRRDFLFVTDVVKAFYQAAKTEQKGRVYNLGAGNPQSVNRLVDLLGGPKVFIPKRPGEPDCTWSDISRITSELDWLPTVSFEEGVEQMLTCISDWKDAPLWDVSSISNATKTWFEYLQEEA
jgi:UDP-glucose 4-epimerase